LSTPEAGTIGPLKRADHEPVFEEPWQAQVFAIADTLSRSGAFTTSEWSAALGEELRRAEESTAPDNATKYYEAALTALERLLIGGGIASPETISDRRDAWVRAYLATPHGQPVKLGNE
jgi:nitrile hydratase accessory protein